MCDRCDAELSARRIVAERDIPGRGAIIVQTPGGLFMGSRPLIGDEIHVNFRAMDSALQTGTDRLKTAWDNIARQQRDLYVKQVRAALASKRRDVIATRTVDATREYQKALEEELARAAAFASKDMLDEIRRQVGGDWTPAPQDNKHAGAPEEISRTRALAIAKAVNNAFQTTLTKSALNVVEGGRLSDLTRVTLPAGVSAYGNEAVSLTVNATRERVAGTEGPKVESAQYSAVMDGDTCFECEAVDGRTFKFGSAEYERFKPPNQRCLSNLNRTRGNQCRCVYVYRFARG